MPLPDLSPKERHVQGSVPLSKRAERRAGDCGANQVIPRAAAMRTQVVLPGKDLAPGGQIPAAKTAGPGRVSLLVIGHLGGHSHQSQVRAVPEHGKVQWLPDRFGEQQFLQALRVGHIHLSDLQEDVAGP